MAAESSDDTIRNPAQVAGILKRLADGRKTINVSTPQSQNQVHTSAILDVNAERRMVLLDELNPAPRDIRALAGKRLGVSAQLGGVDVSFACTVTRLGSKEGITYYVVEMPDKLLYQQRREHYRAAATIESGLPVRLRLKGPEDEEVELEGELTDLSIGGMGVRLPPRTEVPEFLEEHDIIPLCSVDLPDQDVPLECAAELRSLRADGHKIQMGLRFNQLEPRAHRMVEKYVVALDRKQRQRGA